MPTNGKDASVRTPTSTRYRISLATIVALIALATLLAVWPAPADAHTSWCPTIRPPVTVKHVAANLHQRRMTTRVLNVGRRHRANGKVLRSAIMAINQESSATNLAGGHGSSVGLFQIIDIHGSWAQRHNPEWASHWYFSRAINVNHWRPYLTAGQLAQAVQRSAYPDAYARWWDEAYRTLARYRYTCQLPR